jgi:hypothetical protein
MIKKKKQRLMGCYFSSLSEQLCKGIITYPRGGALYVTIVSAYLIVLLAYLAYRVLVFVKDMKAWYRCS